jgi:hypothetical protein
VAAGTASAATSAAAARTPGFDIADFNAFIQRSGLSKFEGQIAPRNAFRSSDVATGDIQIAQEIPALFPKGAKGEFYFDIINFLNLIDRNWGVDTQVGFPYVFAPVTALNCQLSGLTLDGVKVPACAAGRGNFYQYSTFRPQVTSAGVNQFSTVQTLANPPVPTWVLKFGVRYKF